MFPYSHPMCLGRAYGAINSGDVPKLVRVDMTDTTDSYFSPNTGLAEVVVPPKSIKYVCASMGDPNAESVAFGFTIEVEDVDEDAAPDEEED